MSNWRIYSTEAPSISGYEVNTGYLVGTSMLLTNISGGIEVSKIFHGGSISYVDRSVVADYIVNGIYSPTVAYSLDFSNIQNSGYVATFFI